MENKELDAKILALDYKPENILAYEGNKVTNLKQEAYMDQNTYVVVKKEKHDLNCEFDPAITASSSDSTFPGALLFGNKSLVENNPHLLSVDRAPITISVNLPGMNDNKVVVENPNNSNVMNGVNKIVHEWLNKHSGEYDTPSIQSFTMQEVHDDRQLSLSLNCDVKYLKQNLNIDFSYSNTKKKSIYVAKYAQVFYMASAELPITPSGVFANNVSWKDLESRGVNNLNPPVMIQNVQYGQVVFVKFESYLDKEKLDLILKGAVSVKGVDITPEIKANYEKELQEISCSVVSLGGSNKAVKNLFLNDVKSLNEAIKIDEKFSKNNLGFPIYYKAVFLKDNTPAVINAYTEYTTTKSERYNGGNLILKHDGAYVAKFDVSWDEISIDGNGNEKSERKYWSDNGKHRTSGYSTNIALAGNCRNIKVKADGATGLAWEKWRTSVNTNPMPLVPKRTISIWGTTLNQKHQVEPNC